MNNRIAISALALMASASMAFASGSVVSMTAKTSWGFNNDGWWAPGENGVTYLTTDNSQRSMAYNPVTGKVYVANNLGVRGLDGSTGTSSVLLDTTGISGGTRALNQIMVTKDGGIYGANLTVQSTTSPFKIYNWASEGAAPTVAYSGDAGLAGSRIGDDGAGTGIGSGRRLAFGYSNTPSVAGNNGYAVYDPNTNSMTAVGFTGTPPAAGDHRLGITFWGSDVIGGQNGTVVRWSSYAGSAGTLKGTMVFGQTTERAYDILDINGYSLLATIDNASTVRVYDITTMTPSTTITMSSRLVASLNNTTGTLASNTNGTSDVAWGGVVSADNSGTVVSLYAMNTNQGVQAFNIKVVPEPSSIAALALGAGVLLRRRKK